MHDRITVVGTVATVPERRRTSTGAPVISFRLASTHSRLDPQTRQWVQEQTNWYTVSAFRSLAEHALVSFHKGQRVIVAGRFRLREWEANGRQGREAEIEADALGHDLLWGTTAYARDESHAPQTLHAAPQHPLDGAAPVADAWAPPPAGDTPEERPALVSVAASAPPTAGDWHARTGPDDEVPF
ncbi:single-stranded DNA-binding protein [Microbacterium sp. No. 7]|uniref:single-stranded DNA-binding protein n=1 Tax=Microbacterium sp. No. 7 TaxID=1714373 RepID=UPI000ADFCC3D|nr:single-stranded DNA-binding protein [Microbacterium sp. No. 7]